jgi:hypothetical protein
MNATILKIYSLPVVWQLFTVPVMTANFTMAELQNSAKQSKESRARYLLFWLVCVIELTALFAWCVIHFFGYAESYELAAGATFGVSAIILLAWSWSYAWRNKPAFREFLLRVGYTEERIGLPTASSEVRG